MIASASSIQFTPALGSDWDAGGSGGTWHGDSSAVLLTDPSVEKSGTWKTDDTYDPADWEFAPSMPAEWSAAPEAMTGPVGVGGADDPATGTLEYRADPMPESKGACCGSCAGGGECEGSGGGGVHDGASYRL